MKIDTSIDIDRHKSILSYLDNFKCYLQSGHNLYDEHIIKYVGGSDLNIINVRTSQNWSIPITDVVITGNIIYSKTSTLRYVIDLDGKMKPTASNTSTETDKIAALEKRIEELERKTRGILPSPTWPCKL